MGLITGLLTLPLAPVRGVMLIAEIIERQAEAEQYDEPRILAALDELEAARQLGELDEGEIDEAEAVLLDRLMALRGFSGE